MRVFPCDSAHPPGVDRAPPGEEVRVAQREPSGGFLTSWPPRDSGSTQSGSPERTARPLLILALVLVVTSCVREEPRPSTTTSCAGQTPTTTGLLPSGRATEGTRPPAALACAVPTLGPWPTQIPCVTLVSVVTFHGFLSVVECMFESCPGRPYQKR